MPQPGYFSPDFDSSELAAFYDAQGYFVIEDAFDPAEIAAIRDDATAICRGQHGEVKGAPEIPSNATDDEVLRQMLCIHFPHKISPLMRDALAHPTLVRGLTAAIGPNVKCMQSMLFIKSSGKPGQAWHQDEDYIPTRDRSLLGAWISIDHATKENGCLWVLPGSHRPGILWDQHWHGDRRFDCAAESRGFPWTDEDAIPVEVRPGTVVFFNGYTLHRSLPNRAPEGTYRRALVNHYMSCESFCPWQPPAPDYKAGMAKHDYRDVVIVAGQDPYSHHGYATFAEPMLRPDGRSGCVNWTDGKVKEYEDSPS
jgi:phytanoyl-CoA hydroxylase